MPSLESGARSNPEGTTLTALAATLGVSTDYLLNGSGKAPSEGQVRAAVARAEASFTARGAA